MDIDGPFNDIGGECLFAVLYDREPSEEDLLEEIVLVLFCFNPEPMLGPVVHADTLYDHSQSFCQNLASCRSDTV